MTTAAISKFRGLDVRRLRETSDARTARVARNVDLTIGGEFTARDGLRYLMDLDPQSRGLYAIGGTLRAVIPGGQGLPESTIGPVRVLYDHLGFGDGFYISIMVAMTASDRVELQGATWPTNMVGRILTVDGNNYTVASRVSDTVITLSTAFTGFAGYYTFTISGSPTVTTRYCSIPNGSAVVTLTNGVWPVGIEGSTFTITSRALSVRIATRISDTEIRLESDWNGAAITNSEFQVNGLAADYPLDTLVRVTGVEALGANASFGVYPYIVVERWADANDHSLGTVFEHHWIRQGLVNADTALSTQVRLPFSPGPSIVKAAGKLWASDDVNGVVRFSSTANGPSDWTTPEDAGYIPVITHTSGDRRIRALGIYDDKLAVLFGDSVQLWATDPQPSNITLVRVINGPGTTNPRSLVNVLGDLFYFTRGGFRSLTTQTVTGQIQENDDIGAAVDALTESEEGADAVAWWSQARGQYLCAFGQRVYAYRYSPRTKTVGWTTWELGVPVDAVAEINGITYIRSGNKLYRLEAGYADGSTWDVTFNDFTAGDPLIRKRVDFLGVLQRGRADLRVFLQPDNDTYYLQGPTINGSSANMERIFVGAMARTFGFRFTGQGDWTLSAFQVSFLKLGL
jgi:hypothetical protein